MPVPTRTNPLPLQVKKAFSQRRKVIRNSLRPMHDPADVTAALAVAGLNPETRAQDLTLAEFGALAWALHASATEGAASAGEGAEAAAAGEGDVL